MSSGEIQNLLSRWIEKKTGEKVIEIQTNDSEYTFLLEPKQTDADLDHPSA